MTWGRTRDDLIDVAAHERRKRIKIAVAAWAYEHHYKPIMSDSDYDKLAASINPRIATGNHRLDAFFRLHFDASTGMWVHKHPNKAGLENIYARYWYPTLYADDIAREKRRNRRKNRKRR